MKIISAILVYTLVSPYASAAFTETELYQLQEINEKYIRKAEASKVLLDKKVQETIQNLPEQKSKIVNLNKSWDETIEKKCHLFIFESINTDAEIARENDCLANEYLSEMDFFERMNK